VRFKHKYVYLQAILTTIVSNGAYPIHHQVSSEILRVRVLRGVEGEAYQINDHKSGISTSIFRSQSSGGTNICIVK